jgi:hypothetical protein
VLLTPTRVPDANNDALRRDVTAGRVGTPVVGDDTRHLARAIDALGLVVERIVPVHGPVGTIADRRESVAGKLTTR